MSQPPIKPLSLPWQTPATSSVNPINSHGGSSSVSNNTYLSDSVFFSPSDSDCDLDSSVRSSRLHSSVGNNYTGGNWTNELAEDCSRFNGNWNSQSHGVFGRGNFAELGRQIPPNTVRFYLTGREETSNMHTGYTVSERAHVNFTIPQLVDNYHTTPYIPVQSFHHEAAGINTVDLHCPIKMMAQYPFTEIESQIGPFSSQVPQLFDNHSPTMHPNINQTYHRDLAPTKTFGLGCPIMMVKSSPPFSASDAPWDGDNPHGGRGTGGNSYSQLPRAGPDVQPGSSRRNGANQNPTQTASQGQHWGNTATGTAAPPTTHSHGQFWPEEDCSNARTRPTNCVYNRCGPQSSHGHFFQIPAPYYPPTVLQNGCFGRHISSLGAGRVNRHPHGVSIRPKQKQLIKNLLEPGNIIQIYGPPMAGKSTTVKQAIHEKREEVGSSPCPYKLIQHNFDCKAIAQFQTFLSVVAKKVCLQNTTNSSEPDEDDVLGMVSSILRQSPACHHIFLFHKCESLNSDHRVQCQFLDFLSRLQDLHLDITTVVFTTYKTFPLHGDFTETLNIDVLTDIWDIIELLQFYAPNVSAINYAHLCLKLLCFPEAIRLLAEEFLVDERYSYSPEELEKKIATDKRFLKMLFESRVGEVSEWISDEYLQAIVHFCHSVESTFTPEHLEYVNTDCDKREWHRLIRYLERNNAVRQVPGINRLVIHPLLVYYFLTSQHQQRLVLSGHVYDHSCNKFTIFLGRILLNVEEKIRHHGRKGLVYGCLAQEWPQVRYLIERALHCNINTYEAFLQVAVSASGLIIKFFPKEARAFYAALFQSAQEFGSPTHRAVTQAFLGDSLAGTGMAWDQALAHLNSSISQLSQPQFDISYFLVWAINRKAMILHRQGKYKESLIFFKRGRELGRHINTRALEEIFAVSELQVQEEMITQEIQETIPIIFMGDNLLARERLNKLLDIINNTYENHPELAVLLNLIGLTEQRGNKDLASAARWYKLSYNERQYTAKQCPESLLAVLNNIAMVLFRDQKLDECLKYLQKALSIRRDCGWRHYNTGLTLHHLSDVHIGIGNYAEAYKIALEAERIFHETVKDHDIRLRVNMSLAHLRATLRQLSESESYDRDQFGQRTYITSNATVNESTTEGFLSDHQETCELTSHNIPHFNKLLDHDTMKQSDTASPSLTSAGVLSSSEEACSQQDRYQRRQTYSHNSGRDHFQNNARDSIANALPSCEINTFPTSTPVKNSAFLPNRGNFCTQRGQPGQTSSTSSSTGHCDMYARYCSPPATVTQIEPVDLRMSMEDFLNRVLEIASEMTGTLSDDGQANVFSAHEHAMLLNLGNSQEVYENHRIALMQYTEQNHWLEEAMLDERSSTSQYRCLACHRDFYNYILNTPYEKIDFRVFVRHLIATCHNCKFDTNSHTEDMWIREIHHCIQTRAEKERFRQEFDRRRIDPNSFPNDSDGQVQAGAGALKGTLVTLDSPTHQHKNNAESMRREGIPHYEAHNMRTNESLQLNELSHKSNEGIANFHSDYSANSEVTSSSPDLYVKQISTDGQFLQSMADHTSESLILSPKIYEAQRARLEMYGSCITSSSQSSNTDLHLIGRICSTFQSFTTNSNERIMPECSKLISDFENNMTAADDSKNKCSSAVKTMPKSDMPHLERETNKPSPPISDLSNMTEVKMSYLQSIDSESSQEELDQSGADIGLEVRKKAITLDFSTVRDAPDVSGLQNETYLLAHKNIVPSHRNVILNERSSASHLQSISGNVHSPGNEHFSASEYPMKNDNRSVSRDTKRSDSRQESSRRNSHLADISPNIKEDMYCCHSSGTTDDNESGLGSSQRSSGSEGSEAVFSRISSETTIQTQNTVKAKSCLLSERKQFPTLTSPYLQKSTPGKDSPCKGVAYVPASGNVSLNDGARPKKHLPINSPGRESKIHNCDHRMFSNNSPGPVNENFDQLNNNMFPENNSFEGIEDASTDSCSDDLNESPRESVITSWMSKDSLITVIQKSNHNYQ